MAKKTGSGSKGSPATGQLKKSGHLEAKPFMHNSGKSMNGKGGKMRGC